MGFYITNKHLKRLKRFFMVKCQLEGCNKKARRKFCCNKHKDRYHNIHNPRGYYAAKTYEVLYTENVDEGPEGWDGHKI